MTPWTLSTIHKTHQKAIFSTFHFTLVFCAGPIRSFYFQCFIYMWAQSIKRCYFWSFSYTWQETKFFDRTVFTWCDTKWVFDRTNVLMPYLREREAKSRILDTKDFFSFLLMVHCKLFTSPLSSPCYSYFFSIFNKYIYSCCYFCVSCPVLWLGHQEPGKKTHRTTHLATPPS